jgi:hypothetical protein
MHRDDLNHLPHINLRAFGADFTSVCLVLRKEGSFCFEGDALEKRRDYLDSFAALSQLCSLDRDYDKQEKSKLAYRVRQWIRKKMTSLRVRRDVHLSLETWLLNRQRKNNR